MAQQTGGVRLDAADYEQFRQAASTYRKRLIVRLAAEVGLRPAEIVEVRPTDLTTQVQEGTVHYFLAVRGGDAEREAYLPADLKREFDRYVDRNDVAADEPVVSVSARRVQMLVGEVADCAAEETGDRALADCSSADLRRHFARRALDRGVPPAVVMAVGGWRRLDGFAADPAAISQATIAAAFDGSTSSAEGRYRAAFDRIDRPAVLLDADGIAVHANAAFGSVTGLPPREAEGRELRDFTKSVDEREYAAMWEAVTAGETWAGEVNTTVPGGDTVRGRLTVSALGTGRSVAGFVATFESYETESASESVARRTLDRLRTVRAATRAVGEALAAAGTREEVLAGTCERLAASDAYAAAWATDTSGDPAVPTAVAGFDGEAIERLVEREDVRGLIERARSQDGVHATTVSADGGTFALATVPLAHGDTTYGTVTVVNRSRGPADEHERAALATLGERVGGTLAAVEWKRLLLADAVRELAFEGGNVDSPFARASAELDADLRVEGLVPLEGGSLLYYVTVRGVGQDVALGTLEDRTADARLITDYGEESLLEVTVEGPSLPGALAARGANVTELVADGGHVDLQCEVAPSADVRGIVENVTDAFPGIELAAKREVERSVRTPGAFQRSLEEQLTSKQRSVLEAAYHAGYFDWPRGSTAEELADSIGVSSPTLHNHLRRAQRKLLAAFFDGGE